MDRKLETISENIEGHSSKSGIIPTDFGFMVVDSSIQLIEALKTQIALEPHSEMPNVYLRVN